MTHEDLMGAVARGYCTKENEKKVLDSELCVAIVNEIEKLVKVDDISLPDTDQLLTQLAGCLTAAEGVGMDNVAVRGDYGWSPAYQATLELRRNYDAIVDVGLHPRR